MKNLNGDNFCSEDKYKIYRNVYEIIHPTISKRNISNYKVVFDEKLIPAHVFYPNKVSSISSVVIYIPGDGKVTGTYGKYTDICSRLAKEVNKMVVAIDYFDNLKYDFSFNKVYSLVKYLLEEFANNNILYENIYLVADSVSTSMVVDIVSKLIKENIMVKKLLLFYPVIRNNYDSYEWNELYLGMNDGVEVRVNNYLKSFYGNKSNNLLDIKIDKNFPKCCVITGDMDVFKDDGRIFYELLKQTNKNTSYANIKFASHGFLGSNDEDILEDVYREVKKFLV